MVQYAIEPDGSGGYRALITVDGDGTHFASGLSSRADAKEWVDARLQSLGVSETPREALTAASLGGN